MPSGSSSACTPMRRKFSTIVAIRSVSLIRSSPASRTVSPSSLAAPSTASTGISSISAAVVSFSMTPPRTGELEISNSPANSPFWLSTSVMRMAAPMPTRKSSSVDRVGFRPYAADSESGARQQQCRHHKKRRRRKVRWHHQVAPRQRRPPCQRDSPPLDPQIRAEFAQSDLGVVARPHRFTHDGLAFRIQPGEQYARLHLRTSDRAAHSRSAATARRGFRAAESGRRGR